MCLQNRGVTETTVLSTKSGKELLQREQCKDVHARARALQLKQKHQQGSVLYIGEVQTENLDRERCGGWQGGGGEEWRKNKPIVSNSVAVTRERLLSC